MFRLKYHVSRPTLPIRNWNVRSRDFYLPTSHSRPSHHSTSKLHTHESISSAAAHCGVYVFVWFVGVLEGFVVFTLAIMHKHVAGWLVVGWLRCTRSLCVRILLKTTVVEWIKSVGKRIEVVFNRYESQA